MTDRCFHDEDLELLAKLPAGDPRLAHEEECGRCRARLAAFREFMDPSLSHEADERTAVAQISKALNHEIWDADAEIAATRGWIARLRSALWAPALRPVWIAAAAVLLIVAIRQMQLPIGDSDVPSSLRGEPETEVITARALILADGDLQVTWDPYAGADAYRLVILDTGLLEVHRVDTGSELTTTINASSIDTLPGREAGLLWRVLAIRGRNQVARSALHSIEPR